MLGYKDNLNFNLVEIKPSFFLKLKSLAGGKRLLALLQVKEYHKPQENLER